MNFLDRFYKRLFDCVLAAIGLLLFWPIIVIAAICARVSCSDTGIFSQIRVGRHAKRFAVHKIRTMRNIKGTHITTANDPRITPLGEFLRTYKIDELPQLWNVLVGDMSFVGPRPDMPGYADKLEHEDRIILELRPGITGPATLRYRNEEEILAAQSNPKVYNDTVIWPDKVRINRKYLEDYRFSDDLKYIWQTIFSR